MLEQMKLLELFLVRDREVRKAHWTEEERSHLDGGITFALWLWGYSPIIKFRNRRWLKEGPHVNHLIWWFQRVVCAQGAE